MGKRTTFLFLFGAGLAGVFWLYGNWQGSEKENVLPDEKTYERFSLPQSEGQPSSIPPLTPTPPPSQDAGPSSPQTPALQQPLAAEEVNLAIPFTSQAPHANWELPYQEFCEEASVLMAASYVLGQGIPTPDYADAEMRKIMAFEEQRFGYYKDTTAEETAVILREYYGLANVSVVYDPDVAAIKNELAEGKTVLVPAAGRQLGNPYFTQPGPLYHMLVIKGYTKDGRLITNDPGTRRGANFLYDPNVLLNAVHDWNGGAVESGRKVMIVVG